MNESLLAKFWPSQSVLSCEASRTRECRSRHFGGFLKLAPSRLKEEPKQENKPVFQEMFTISHV